jgi:hypothetical protein
MLEATIAGSVTEPASVHPPFCMSPCTSKLRELSDILTLNFVGVWDCSEFAATIVADGASISTLGHWMRLPHPLRRRLTTSSERLRFGLSWSSDRFAQVRGM